MLIGAIVPPHAEPLTSYQCPLMSYFSHQASTSTRCHFYREKICLAHRIIKLKGLSVGIGIYLSQSSFGGRFKTIVWVEPLLNKGLDL